MQVAVVHQQPLRARQPGRAVQKFAEVRVHGAAQPPPLTGQQRVHEWALRRSPLQPRRGVVPDQRVFGAHPRRTRRQVGEDVHDPADVPPRVVRRRSWRVRTHHHQPGPLRPLEAQVEHRRVPGHAAQGGIDAADPPELRGAGALRAVHLHRQHPAAPGHPVGGVEAPTVEEFGLPRGDELDDLGDGGRRGPRHEGRPAAPPSNQSVTAVTSLSNGRALSSRSTGHVSPASQRSSLDLRPGTSVSS